MKITDVTLCTISVNDAPKEKLSELYHLLLQTGINFIEINEEILSILNNEINRSVTVLRVQNPKEISGYPGFSRYICRYSGYDTPSGTISEFQINDIREVNLMKKYSEYENIRVVGLDDLMQHDYLAVFEKLKKICGGRIEFCPQNSLFCAGALATEWLLNGGDSIAASFSGSGGFAPLEEVLIALRISKRYKPNLDLSVLQNIKKIYEELTGDNIPGNKAVIGNGIFDVESGVHVDGIYKNSSNYEPFDPSVVGMKRKVVIGKHSGRTTIEIKLNEHNISLPETMKAQLLKCVQQESIRKGRSIDDTEFVELAAKLKNN